MRDDTRALRFRWRPHTHVPRVHTAEYRIGRAHLKLSTQNRCTRLEHWLSTEDRIAAAAVAALEPRIPSSSSSWSPRAGISRCHLHNRARAARTNEACYSRARVQRDATSPQTERIDAGECAAYETAFTCESTHAQVKSRSRLLAECEQTRMIVKQSAIITVQGNLISHLYGFSIGKQMSKYKSERMSPNCL